MKINKAIGYLRTATTMQDNANRSLYNQKKSILTWAKENNIQIVKIYSEVSSGFRGERPVLDLMIKEIDEGVVTPDTLIVYSLDRLSRNNSTTEAINSLFSEKNIEVIPVSNSTSDTQDSIFCLHTFIDMFNELQSKANSKIVQDSLNSTAEKGYFTGGSIPFGYSSVPVIVPNTNATKKTLVINPIEAAIVKQLFNLATTGTNGNQLSFSGIARFLNQQNLMRRGKPWNCKKISIILNNPIYHGERLWGKNRASEYKHQAPITIKTPSIVSKEQFISALAVPRLRTQYLRGQRNES